MSCGCLAKAKVCGLANLNGYIDLVLIVPARIVRYSVDGCRGNARVLVPDKFFGLFSKDARVVIGAFFPRTHLFRANNVTY